MTDKEKILERARADRRRYRRVPVDLPGRLFIPGDEREAACTVLDMSAGGAHIRCEFVPPLDTAIVLYIEGFGRFEGAIVRAGDGEFGVRFNCSALKRERVAEQLTLHMNKAQVDNSVLRRHERAPTRGMARFTRANGDVVSCEVLDLSLSGVSLKTDQRPPVGEFVLIGQMAGRVARHHEDGVAIEFVGNAQGSATSDTPAARPKLFAVR